MADVRINALSTTATSAASDDYLALDGSANGTRKILATNVAQNVTDVTFGTSGPSAKSSIAARAARQGLVSDGTAGATVASVPAFGTSDFTVAAWVNPVATGSTQYIFSGGSTAFGLRLLNGGTIQTTKMGTADNTASSGTLTAGKSALVVYTRSGTTGTYYINGVSAGTTTDSQDYWTGSILTPIAENRALSAAEVLALYEAGVPSGGDYNNASNTNLNSSTVTTAGSGSVTGASATGFAATATGAFWVRTAPVFSIIKGAKYRVSFTASSLTGTWNAYISLFNTAIDSALYPVSSGANSFEMVANVTRTTNEVIEFSSIGPSTLTVSGLSVQPLGLLLAPDAAQTGGGLVWYDTSGNAANITLPASGVTWNVPSSLKTATGWTFGGNLTVSGTGTFSGNLTSNGNVVQVGASGSGTGGNFRVVDDGGSLKWLSGLLGGIGARDYSIYDVVNSRYAVTVASSTGNVLLGTTIDGGQKLQVAGAIAATTGAANNAIVARYNSSNSLFGVTVNSAGQGVVSENTDASTGSDAYSKTGLPAFRLGNTGGSGTVPFWIDVAASGTAGGAITWTNAFKIDASKNSTFAGTVSPQQAATASAPSYVKGAIYFDTTLNKLRVGGATGWETITSV